MLSFLDCKEIIDREISGLTFKQNKPEELYEPVSYILQLGGKRIRPALALMTCELFAGRLEDVIYPALAVEIFHNFTLLHDDIMDKAPVRRNKPTVHEKWNENIAILSGDAMNIIAYQHLCRTRTEFIPELLDVFSGVALEICEGQQLDMNYESRTNVSLLEYLEMIRLKTAVLLATSLKIGAVCGKAPGHEKELLYNFGLNLGLAFQVRDDLLDTFGTQEEFGKSIGGDIRAGKKTYIYLKALEMASPSQYEELSGLYSDKQTDPDKKINRVIRIFNDLHVREKAEETVANYTAAAMKSLGMVNAAGSKKELESLAYQIMKRKA